MNALVQIRDGEPVADSRDIAEHFGKRHDTVLRAIRTLLQDVPDLPLRNFVEGSYTLPTTGSQMHPFYRMSRDGFALLVMGFTGKEALAWKVKFLEAFNLMESELRAQSAALPPPAHDPWQLQVQNEEVALADKLFGTEFAARVWNAQPGRTQITIGAGARLPTYR